MLLNGVVGEDLKCLLDLRRLNEINADYSLKGLILNVELQ